jgi:hypothetical protein
MGKLSPPAAPGGLAPLPPRHRLPPRIPATAMSRRTSTILLAGALFLTFASTAPAAMAAVPIHENSAHSPTLAIQGSNGFEFGITRSGRYLFIGTWSHRAHAGVLYITKGGVPAANGVEAHLGKLGDVSVRFKPSGPRKRLHGYPSTCEKTATRGHFVGSIDFTGELSYTEVHAHRAKGELTITHGDCDTFNRPSVLAQPLLKGEKSAISAHSRDHSSDIAFSCSHGKDDEIGPFNSADTNRRYFEVWVSTRYRSIGVNRIVQVSSADPASLIFDDAAETATVAPPPPFSGSASYEKLPSSGPRWGSWFGTLSVSLPGLADPVAIAGPSFKANTNHDFDARSSLGRFK